MRDTPDIPHHALADDHATQTTEAATPQRLTPLERLKALAQERTPLMVVGVVAVLIVFAIAMFLNGRSVSTDNAYLNSARTAVSASVSGRVVEMRVTENQHVEAGQVLFVIDPDIFNADLQEKEASLAAAKARALQLRADYISAAATVRAADDRLGFTQRQLDRERALRQEGLSADQQVETADQALSDARRGLLNAKAALAAARASLAGDPNRPIRQHPIVREAAAKLARARIAKSSSEVKALQAGIVTRVDQMQPGAYVNAGQPVFWIVAAKPWVEANFKEDQLEEMRIGQLATVHLDAYPKLKLKARLDSFSPGTGSVFSVIPAQNASGNWVKVVQRVPVRLSLIDPPEDVFLGAGLSAKVTIDTVHHKTKSTDHAAQNGVTQGPDTRAGI